ncbi:MAG: PKD domain-containing protein, partial [Deltaproteobacteria bacterium]|nr:PKD domain-containing protein [Deltaproteobacteria bacterium]
TLKVTDDRGSSKTTSTPITVRATNQPPIARFTASPNQGIAPLEVGLSNNSSDPEGKPLSYTWDFGDGQSSIETNPKHTYNKPSGGAPYKVVLKVKDDKGLEAIGTGYITVTTNKPPKASISATPTSGQAPLKVYFSSSASQDEDGSISSYSWNFGDGTSSEQPNPGEHTYNQSGNYSVKLTVTDNRRATNTATGSITVTKPNQPPIAKASASPVDGNVPLKVGFSSSGSADPEGQALTYNWNFGDGTSSKEANPTHSYTIARANPYSITLKVMDNKGLSATASCRVMVRPAKKK